MVIEEGCVVTNVGPTITLSLEIDTPSIHLVVVESTVDVADVFTAKLFFRPPLYGFFVKIPIASVPKR
jgi:hypothetical protein